MTPSELQHLRPRGNFRDLIGVRFSRLLVIARSGRTKSGQAIWLCKCDCGTEKPVVANSLVRGVTKSCGCLKAEAVRRPRPNHAVVHGHAHRGNQTRTYRIWRNMKNRCELRSCPEFALYGARGISVCERWRSFSAFVADMGECPAGLSIDRINNDGNYEPGNCRWATSTEQARNTRANKLSYQKADEIRALVTSGARRVEVAKRFGVSKSTIDSVMSGESWTRSMP